MIWDGLGGFGMIDPTLSKMYPLSDTVLTPALNFMFQEGKQTCARGFVDPLLLGGSGLMQNRIQAPVTDLSLVST